jgi:hypothetical protein
MFYLSLRSLLSLSKERQTGVGTVLPFGGSLLQNPTDFEEFFQVFQKNIVFLKEEALCFLVQRTVGSLKKT